MTILKVSRLGSGYSLVSSCNRDSLERLGRFLISLIREIGYELAGLYKTCRGYRHQYHRCERAITWNPESRGLYVMIHGLKSHPSVWDSYLDELKKDPTLDLFAPEVPCGGNCGLDKAGRPILEKILSYVKKFPHNPVCLIGTSNGGRIAFWLEVKLRENAAQTAVKVSSIAGAHFGSSFMSNLNRYEWLRTLHHEDVQDELELGSEKARELIGKVKEPFEGNRSYDLYGSPDDFIIPDMHSTLPFLAKGEMHQVVPGQGHRTLVEAVRSQVVARCQEWMNQVSSTPLPE